MEQSKKKITIITVVKNSEATIERCIKSVLSQNYKNIEYIIIDGNSSDGTKEIINKYRDQISKIIIGDDGGIWEAMNKGINLASGEILGFLNSDDYYYEKTTEIVNNYFSNNNIDFLFGSVEKYKLMHGYSPWKVRWSFGFYTSHSVGFFIKTKKHLDVGLYNSRYLSADLDFFYKMIISSLVLNGLVKKFQTKLNLQKTRILNERSKKSIHSIIDYISKEMFYLDSIKS